MLDVQFLYILIIRLQCKKKSKATNEILKLDILRNDLFKSVRYKNSHIYEASLSRDMLEFSIRGETLKKIDNNAFKDLFMRSLRIEYSKIKTINSLLFRNVTILEKVIFLENKNLESIEDNSFKGILNLSSIVINDSLLININFINGLKYLTELDLSNNMIKSIDSNLSRSKLYKKNSFL